MDKATTEDFSRFIGDLAEGALAEFVEAWNEQDSEFIKAGALGGSRQRLFAGKLAMRHFQEAQSTAMKRLIRFSADEKINVGELTVAAKPHLERLTGEITQALRQRYYSSAHRARMQSQAEPDEMQKLECALKDQLTTALADAVKGYVDGERIMAPQLTLPEKRFQLLKRIYDMTGANVMEDVKLSEVAETLEFETEFAQAIASYLAERELIKFTVMGPSVSNTALGIDEVEEAMRDPERGTANFPPIINVLNIGTMIGSQVQQGSPEATLTATIGEINFSEVEPLIKEIADKLDELALESVSRSDVEAEIATIQAQLAASKPKPSVVSECLTSIRSILESAASGAIGAGLIDRISSLLSS